MYAIETITDRITLVMLSINIWSGRKKLRPEDLHLAGGDLPPDDLVSLGSKRVCDPDALKVFSRIKQSAERACLRVGTRFLGGYAVPHEHAEELAEKLEALKVQFEIKTADFLRDYDQDLEQWIASLPEWEAPIRRAIEPANVVGGRLRFGYQLVQIAPADQTGTLEEEVKGLGNGIFAEVAQMARDLEGSFEGKAKLHRRALSTVGRVREKLACLSFIDARIEPIVETIDDWVGRLPKIGPIEGAIFNEGMGLALLLGDPERMARHGAGQLTALNGRDEEPYAEEAEDFFRNAMEGLFIEAEAAEPATAPSPERFEFETEEIQPTPPAPVHSTEPESEGFFF